MTAPPKPQPTETYIDQCLREGRVVRWPEKSMPIKVYVAPFRWYEQSKQQESNAYHGMVMTALEKWSRLTQGAVTFRLVHSLNDSQIDINWRRVDRKSLGHCEYLVDKNHQIYSAEIKIGISDGLVHARYNDVDEVNHTILHEIGHALGLVGHSPYSEDIMYVPHQFGVVDVSPRDVNTLKWIYRLPVGFNWQYYLKKHQLPATTSIHDVLRHLEGKPLTKPTAEAGTAPSPKPPVRKENPKVLEHHQAILTQMGKFHLATQNIRIQPKPANPIPPKVIEAPPDQVPSDSPKDPRVD